MHEFKGEGKQREEMRDWRGMGKKNKTDAVEDWDDDLSDQEIFRRQTYLSSHPHLRFSLNMHKILMQKTNKIQGMSTCLCVCVAGWWCSLPVTYGINTVRTSAW